MKQQPDKSIDEQMEDAAYQPTASNLDNAGKPTSPVLKIDEILQSEPRYLWWDIKYQGKVQAIQVMRGQIIHYLGTLDDADLLLIAPIYDMHNDVPEPDDTDDAPDDTDDATLTIPMRRKPQDLLPLKTGISWKAWNTRAL